MSFGQKAREADSLLRHWLESSGIPAGGRLPSERNLARDLGVHHSVMNRTMSRLIAEGLVERVGYKRFRSAADDSPSPLLAQFDLVALQRSRRLGNIRKVARELGASLNEHLCKSPDEMAACLESLSRSTSEAVIIMVPAGDESHIWEPAARALARSGLPVISCGQHLRHLSSVSSGRGIEPVFERLAALGHRELGLLVSSPWTGSVRETTARWTELCLRHSMGDSSSRVIHQKRSQILREDLIALADRLTDEWRAVSALVISTDDELPIQQFLDILRRRKIAVPRRLSIVSLSDHLALQTANPPVAAVVPDLLMVHEAAFLLAQRALRKKSRLGMLSPSTALRIEPHLMERGSLAPCNSPAPTGRARESKQPIRLLPEPETEPVAKHDYDLVRDTSKPRFRLLDLSGHVNRPLNFRRGWLGDLPLTALPPGQHRFHGVPFRILGGPTRQDCGAIVFQSLRNTTGRTKKLPSKLRLAVNSKAAAIYILHGCGYVKNLARFGSYSFFHEQTKLGEIPLVALGRPRPETPTWELAEALTEANIQDWWPDFPHCNFRHGRMAPLADSTSSGPSRGHIYLYTLEWINPCPETPVSHIEVETDPLQSTTLGVLAASVLRI